MKMKKNIGLEIDPDDKEYRGYQRKKESYTALLHKTREFKERKLQAAIDDLHQSFHSVDVSLDGTSTSLDATTNGTNGGGGVKPETQRLQKVRPQARRIFGVAIDDSRGFCCQQCCATSN
jgi:hypothetical protein